MLEMDGQKAMVIHCIRLRASGVAVALRPLSVANWRGIRGLCNQEGREAEKEEEERRISAWPPSEERSNRCQLGEMREERGDDDGDDDDDERRAVGTMRIG